MTRIPGSIALAALVAALSACSMDTMRGASGANETARAPTSLTDARTDMPRIDVDMARVIAAHDALGPKPLETLTAEEARRQPTPADAVRSLLRQDGRSTAPLPMARVQNITIATPVGRLPARVYVPEGSGPMPVVVYFHGGGWVIADLDTYDASARAIASEAKAIVVSARYRQGPEHKFPAAHEDAFAAWRWTLRNARSLGGDPNLIAVAGESAGGNLAANVAIMAKREGVQAPVHQILIYPVAGSDMDTPSYRTNANAKPLNRAMMGWFAEKYLRGQQDMTDPRINLVAANDLGGLPPATIVLAEIDPLSSEGEAYGQRLADAGVPVRIVEFQGVTHEFFGMAPAVADAQRAQQFVGMRLREAFAARRSGS